MAEQTDGSWPECADEGCTGVQLAASQMCLAHASDEERDSAVGAINESGAVDARGVSFSSELLDRVLAAAPRDDNDRAVFKSSLFDRATFAGDAGFDGAIFAGGAVFAGATFAGRAVFRGATFISDADFRGATFTGRADFLGATFTRRAEFSQATFSGDVWFSGATFTGDAMFFDATFTRRAEFGAVFSGATFTRFAVFAGATFTGGAVFAGATFTGGAVFAGATFISDAEFREATFTGRADFLGATFTRRAEFWAAIFSGDVSFRGVTFTHRANFMRTRFEQARKFGPLLAYRGLVLDDAQFAQQVQIEVSATGLCCRRARFPAGVQFRLRWARVVLDDTDFPVPSLLSGVPDLADAKLASREERIAQVWQRLLAGEISERPSLLSLQRANVAGLGLSNVAVADCCFAGAHNLDMLRLEANVIFAAAPAPLGRLSWEGRQVIAEERAWRAARRHRWGWTAPSWPNWLDQRPSVLDAGQIAGLYRALRKGREDTKDEPGAADFYYGEMEMRRRARPTKGGADGTLAASASRGRAERGLLTAYWLVSGYGLRAWRALAWLAVLTALFAVAFHRIGFAQPPHPVSYWTSLLYAFRATLSLTDGNVQLTAWGQLLQGLLRLTGPVLLGLALLSLRGRVKR
jgi:uncharacterized protein YjbI with pentapeptide repeats